MQVAGSIGLGVPATCSPQQKVPDQANTFDDTGIHCRPMAGISPQFQFPTLGVWQVTQSSRVVHVHVHRSGRWIRWGFYASRCEQTVSCQNIRLPVWYMEVLIHCTRLNQVSLYQVWYSSDLIHRDPPGELQP